MAALVAQGTGCRTALDTGAVPWEHRAAIEESCPISILPLARRDVLGGLLLGLATRASAVNGRTDGAVGLVCTAAGLAGLLFEGENGAVLDPRSQWHIGSNTKAMTAALYARLVDQGRCRWDATLRDLFPAIPMHAAWPTVRVDELMSHAAGLTDDAINGPWLLAHHADRSPPREQRRPFVTQLLAAPPGGSRGSFRYGNANYVLLGAAIEGACDAAWEEVLRRELLDPLGMRETGFGAPPRDGLWGRQGAGTTLLAVDPAGIADNPRVLWPSGGVHLSATDYAAFLSLFLRNGYPLLTPAMVRRLLTPSTPGVRYAGGWSLDGPATNPAALLGHNGSNTLWYASARVDRANGRAYAVVVNKGGEGGAAVTGRLLRRLRVVPLNPRSPPASG